MKIGYARASTAEQDLTAQRNSLEGLGVDLENIYVDHGLTGTNRDRPGLRQAMAASRAGDVFVVAKLDRLARSLRDARDTIYREVIRDRRPPEGKAPTTERTESVCRPSSR